MRLVSAAPSSWEAVLRLLVLLSTRALTRGKPKPYSSIVSFRRYLRFKVASAMAVVGAQSASTSAFDRNDDPTACGGIAFVQHLEYRFVDGAGSWTADEKILARQAIEKWNAFLDVGGAHILTSTEVNTGGIQLVRGLSGTGQSNTVCTNGVPVVNIKSPLATLAVPGSLPNTTLHETAHARSLDHVGGTETQMYDGAVVSGREPRMTGCGTNAAHSAYPESDDWAQLIAKQHGSSSPLGTYNPDPGFETYEYSEDLAVGSRRSSLRAWAGVKDVITNYSNGYAAVGSAPEPVKGFETRAGLLALDLGLA